MALMDDQDTAAALFDQVRRLKTENADLLRFEADVELETAAWLDVSDRTKDMTPTERVLRAVKAMHADAMAYHEARTAPMRIKLGQPATPIGYTWTYQGMRHFTGHREVAEQIAAAATELGAPVEVQPVCIAGAAIGKGGAS